MSFQFKQFTVQQDKTAMKVTTDACLFGSWVADLIKNEKLKIKNLLDIGAGTGLLSLMVAQEINTSADAVEIDAAAYQQARENFAASPWQEKLEVYNSDIINFNPGKKYDLVISNPPFFEGDLRSADKKKNAAKHDTSLTLQQLTEAVDRDLAADGCFAVLLPYHRTEAFITMAADRGLYLIHQSLVKQTPSHNFFRSMLLFGRNKTEQAQSEITIKGVDGNYTAEFIRLLKAYYLYL